MGEHVENCEVIAHRTAGGNATDYRLRIHKGSTSLDDTSSTYDKDQHDDLKTEASVSQAAFDTEVEAAVGSSWYATKPQGAKEAWRAIYEDL